MGFKRVFYRICMVRLEGFEPSRREARAPQARVSTVPPQSRSSKFRLKYYYQITSSLFN